MIQLKVTLEGDKLLARDLMVVADGMKNWKPALEKVNREVLKSFDMNFDSEGGLFQQGGWPARKKAYPWPILEKTGRMRMAFVSSVSETEAVFSNPTPYFKYHQSNKPRTRLPRRIMMALDDDRKTFIVKAFQEHIVNTLQGRK